MKHYKQLIDKELFESTYDIKLDDYNLYANTKGIISIPTICDNCKQIFWINRQTFKKRLCYTEFYEKCFGDTWYCNRKECCSKKKSDVCKIKMLQSESSINKRLEASKNRRGKTYEEQYGNEKAKEIKAIIKQKRKEQSEPMLGKHHSDKAKLLMSLRKKELISKNELNWQNAITGENCSYIESIVSKAKLWHKNSENRKLHVEKTIQGTLNNFRQKENFILRWLDNKKILCQSSYEEKYVTLLNEHKVYYDRCNFIIPYTFENHIRYYNPDFIIYKDDKMQNIEYIIEIKPKLFILGNSKYCEKTKTKLKALESFCGYNNYKMIIITEDELNENKIY